MSAVDSVIEISPNEKTDSEDADPSTLNPSLHDESANDMNIKDRPLENTPQKVVGGHEAILDGMGPKHSPNKEQPDTLLQNDPEDDKRDESENKMVDRTEGEHLLEKNDIRRGGPPTENDLPPRIGKINGSGVVEVVTPTTLEDHNDENELKKLDYEPLVSGSDNNDDSTDKTNFTTVTSAATLDSAYECRREELLERHKALLELRHKAGHLNMQLQTTLSEHFRRRRVEGGDTAHSNIDSMTSSLIDTGIDYTSRYAKYMETLAQVRSQFLEQKERLEQEISSLKELSNHKSNNATNKQAELAEFLLGQGKKAISSRTGRPLPTEHYKSLIETWQRKTATVAIERLENLKLQREVEKINAAFKAYDLSESLHLIDFEQMKIENQTYNEKIEERNEETSKLRRKITNMVQMITHANEKLQFCQAENSQLKDQLNLWAEKSSNGRDTLTKLKQVRDALRANHAALVRACGLLGRPEMLRGYEQSVNDVELKKHEISNMKQLTQKLQVKAKVYEDKFSHERRQH